MKGVILGLRQIRGEMDISPARRLVAAGAGCDSGGSQRTSNAMQALLGRLAGIDPVRVLAAGETAPPSAAAVVGNLTLLVPMQGLIDPAVELARLKRKQEKNQQEIARALAKLENPNFVNHAPPEVVATERERIAQFEKVNESLARQIRNRAGSGADAVRPLGAPSMTSAARASFEPSTPSSSARARRCGWPSPACWRAATC